MDIADREPVVIIVAAEERELRGLIRRLRPERLSWPLDYAARSGRWILVANGAGKERAAEAVDTAFNRENVAAVVSAGYCGALDPALAVADVVVAGSVNGIACAEPEIFARFIEGNVLSVDRVVRTAREKSELRNSGAVAVEMEAASVADKAAAAGVPFYCIRVVTDVAGEDLAVDYNAARDTSGRIRTVSVVVQALKHPVRGFPEVLRLAKRSQRASEVLGEFLAGCRF